MQNGIHFISGLPRSGSTLLAALLRQNPAVHANITSPVGSLVGAILKDMSQDNETSVFIDKVQRETLLRGPVRELLPRHPADQKPCSTPIGAGPGASTYWCICSPNAG